MRIAILITTIFYLSVFLPLVDDRGFFIFCNMSRTLELEGFFQKTSNEQETIVTEIAESFLKQVYKMGASLQMAKEHLERLIINAIDNEDYEVAEVFRRILETIENAIDYENELRQKNSVNVNLNRNLYF